MFLAQSLLFKFFTHDHIHNVVSMLPDVLEIGVDSTLFNVVSINIEIGSVYWTLLMVVNSNVDIHNVVSTLI